MDPLTRSFNFYSLFQFSGNTPIVAIDLDGKEDVWFRFLEQNDGSYLLVSTVHDVSELDNNELKTETGQEIPRTGVLYTATTLDGCVIVLTYTPTAVVSESKNLNLILIRGFIKTWEEKNLGN